MPSLVERARTGARGVALGAWTLGTMQSALLHARLRPSGGDALRERWVRRWAGGLLRVFGIEERVVTPAPPPSGKARLVVANHRAPLDILLMLHHCGGSVLARSDLEHWPLLGRAAREGGTIFVDRDSAHSGARAIRAIRRELRAGRTVTVFPEGTTHRGDEVHPFHGGAFAAARGLDVEIVPVGVAYAPGSEFVDETFVEHVTRMTGTRRVVIGTCFGTPRPVAGSRDELARTLREEVQGLVTRAREAQRR